MQNWQATAGRWYVESGEVVHPAKGSLLRANRDNHRTLPCERDDNVALAAAAPAMLQFLQGIAAMGDDSSALVIRARAFLHSLGLPATTFLSIKTGDTHE